jgi:hypothetical protein
MSSITWSVVRSDSLSATRITSTPGTRCSIAVPLAPLSQHTLDTPSAFRPVFTAEQRLASLSITNAMRAMSRPAASPRALTTSGPAVFLPFMAVCAIARADSARSAPSCEFSA